jgi:hypothetical protein
MAQTLAGTVMGTIAYMSPEQARGLEIRQTSDIFSTGVVLYEMVTGALPFKGGTPLDTMHSIAFEEAKPVTFMRRNLPPQLHRIITKCLRKKPEDRYEDAQSLAADLKRLKQEIETGVQSTISPLERIQWALDWVKSAVPLGPPGIIIAILAVCLTAIFIFTDIPWAMLFWIAIFGLLVYRYIKNRKSRMLKKFISVMSKYPGVRAIFRLNDRVTVVVDEAQAKLYLRANDLVENMNSGLFFGTPFQVAIRDDLSEEEFQRMLRKTGVVYVRDDVVLQTLPSQGGDSTSASRDESNTV